MKFGVCTSVEHTGRLMAAGWDFVEENVQNSLQGNRPDGQWHGAEILKGSALPILAANSLVPGDLKICGPEADLNLLKQYMMTVLKRAGEFGIKTLVFGSGAARKVPDGFSRDEARRQILDFVQMSADIAGRHDVMLVAEPLNRKECNIINSVQEAMTYVKELNHDYFLCLVDSYHFWLEKEPLSNLRAAMRWIHHVHVADEIGRTPPGESGKSDYRPFFKTLKEGKYDRLISVEASGFDDLETVGARALKFLRKQWNEA